MSAPEVTHGFVPVGELSHEDAELLATVRDEVAAATNDGAEVAITYCGHRGYVAEAYSGADRTDAARMAAGPWRPTVTEALQDLSAEWARGCE